jgi:hypothetical protein
MIFAADGQAVRARIAEFSDLVKTIATTILTTIENLGD